MSIEVRQVSKQFSTFRALSDINLEFPTGKLVALLGRLAAVKQRCYALLQG